MAQLTAAEFREAVATLAAHYGIERLRERLARMNAFTSRRGLNSAAAIAERLHLLTGGLRREVAATFAFSSLWNEMVVARLGEEGEKRIETLTEQVNACLDEREAVIPGMDDALEDALVAYRDTLDAVLGPRAAELDMLLKAVPVVAERLRRGLRGGPGGTPPAA